MPFFFIGSLLGKDGSWRHLYLCSKNVSIFKECSSSKDVSKLNFNSQSRVVLGKNKLKYG
jgi:hypothetical protein